MSARSIFFGFSGRINRAKYWGYSILLTLILCLLLAALIAIGVSMHAANNVPLLIGLIVLGVAMSIGILVSQVAIGVKRLHDRGKTGWWLFLYYFVPGALQQPQAWDQSRALAIGVSIFLALAALGIMIWSFIDLGCLRGTEGPNAYGPDPLLRD